MLVNLLGCIVGEVVPLKHNCVALTGCTTFTNRKFGGAWNAYKT